MARYQVITPETEAPPPPSRQTGRYRVLDESAPDPFTTGAVQGLTLGWGDELQALLGINTLEAARERTRRAADIAPGTYRAGQFTGGVGTAVIPGGAMVRSLQAGGGLLGAARAGAVVGGGLGAVEALGEHENKTGDPWGAAAATGFGGLVGGAAGGVGAPVLYGLGSGIRAGARVLGDYARGSSQAALRKTAEALERQGTTPGALADRLVADAAPGVRALHASKPEVLQDIIRGFQQGQTATQIAAAVNRAHGTTLTHPQIGILQAGFNRANPTPRDLLRLSEEVGAGTAESNRSGLTGMMQGVATLQGRGREIALANMGRTVEEAPERLVRRLSAETGAGTDFRGAMAANREARATAAQQAYAVAHQEALNVAVGGGPTVPGLIQPLLKQWTFRAVNMAGERRGHMRRALEIMSGAHAGTKPGSLGVQTLDDFHKARQELDQLLSGLRRSQAPADRDAARIIGGMRREMNDAVQKAYPAFRDADRRFASDLAREEAMDLGRQYALRLGQRQDDVLKEMRNLELRNPTVVPELREHMMQGIVRTMADDIGTAGGIPTKMIQPLTGGIRPGPREALESVLAAPLPGATAGRGGLVPPHAPGRQMTNDIMGVLNDEARLRKIFTDVWQNSKTAERLAAQSDMAELPRIAAEIVTGGWLSSMRQAVAARIRRAITERNNEQIARIVTETDPRVLYLALQDMQRALPGVRAGERGIAASAVAAASAAGQQITGP